MIRMRNLMISLVLLVSVLFGAGFIPLPGPGIVSVLARQVSDPEPPEGEEFVTIESSSLSAYTNDVPAFYQVGAVDTSDWITYDATCECLVNRDEGVYQSGCYPTPPVDASQMQDANGNNCTPAAGTYAFPNEWNTEPVLADGTATVGDAVTTDNGPRLRQMLIGGDWFTQEGANWVDYLVYLPNGRYDIVDPGNTIDTGYLWRPSGGSGSGNAYDASRVRHRRGIVGESQDAILTLYTGMVPPAGVPVGSTYRGCSAGTVDFGSPGAPNEVTGNVSGGASIVCTGADNNFVGIDTKEPNTETAVDWEAGFLPGAQVITVSDASMFSTTEYARGSYARLRSWHTETQSRTEREYVSPVVCIELPPAAPSGPDCSGMLDTTGTHRIKIQHPLPAEFASTTTQDTSTALFRPGDLASGPIVYPLSPSHELVFRNFTMEYDNPHHGTGELIRLQNTVRSEISGMRLRKSGTRWILVQSPNSDILIKSNDFIDNARDKSSNSYGIQFSGVSRVWFHDNFVRHQMPMVMGGPTFQALLTFNDIRGPIAACEDGNNDGVCDSGASPYTAGYLSQVDNGAGRPRSQQSYDTQCDWADPMAAWGVRDGCVDVDPADGQCDVNPSLAQAPGFTEDENGGSNDIDCRIDPHVRVADLNVTTGAHTGNDASGHLHYPMVRSIDVNAWMCTGANLPYSCCTGAGTGTCPGTYTHCASPVSAGQTANNKARYGDNWGLSGDPSCRGVPAGGLYGCIEWHNASSESTLFMRNFCEGNAWLDDNNGPGDSQFIYGNWFAGPGPEGSRYSKVSRTRTFNTAPGSDLGSLDASRMGNEGNSNSIYNYQTLLLSDWHIQNNVWEGNLGSEFGGAFDSYGSGTTVTDNVVGGTCYSTTGDATGCTTESNPNRPAQNVTFTDNTFGDDVHPGTYTRVMPSLPGFSDWPEFSGATVGSSLPHVGPEMGDPDLITAPCLPASYRNNACQRDSINVSVP